MLCYYTVNHGMISFSLRSVFGFFIAPLEYLCVTAMAICVVDPILLRPKWIPIRHAKTDEKIRVDLFHIISYPTSLMFNEKIKSDAMRVENVFFVSAGFAFLYPLLCGLFLKSDVLVQAILVPIFFVLRSCYEYVTDGVTSKTFGSDAMPIATFAGVTMHEVCLSIMMTSLNHPLVLVVLILADVLENCYCLYSLHRMVSPLRSNKIAPEGEETRVVRRTSSVYKLVGDLDGKSTEEVRGTALFITATLLQRELVETIVPVQSLGVISALYWLDVKSNSVVSGWDSNEDYHDALIHIGIDLGVEVLVFAFTILALNRIFPELNTLGILRGLMKMHSVSMFMIMCAVWLANLLFQCTYSGMDPLFKFQWLGCDGKANSSWVGGYEWEC